MKKKKARLVPVFTFIFGFTITIIGIYIVTAISSSEILYDNTSSGIASNTLQGAIDILYKKALGEGDSTYTEDILNGTDPVLGEGMIPVTIDGDGTVKYASLKSKWYSYKEHEWANAVILSTSSTATYTPGSTISESDIESYFVWIPRYKYKLWNASQADGYYQLTNITDSTTWNDLTALGKVNNNARIIDIVFENKNTTASTGTSNGEYLTHPAFTNFDVNGIWIGKFEVSYDNGIKVKPNVTSWRGVNVKTFFTTMLEYKEELNSHMMKNTEWGSVAYLSHSKYGIGHEVNINNNNGFITGYSAAPNTDQSSFTGTSGNSSSGLTEPYNTAIGYLASTTGNITGVYDMSGGANEYMAAVRGNTPNESVSGFSTDDLITYADYLDIYPSDTTSTSYSKRILGDATGEMGPFYYFRDKDTVSWKNLHNSWYFDYSYFVTSSYPWFSRSGDFYSGVLNGQFRFANSAGEANNEVSSRFVVLY